MIKTSTQPNLANLESLSKTDWASNESFTDEELLEDLTNEFSEVIYVAPQSLVDKVMAYSASHKVQQSEIIMDTNVVFLN
jgi:predicted HAD superfamily phosphohydrolase